MGVGRPIPLKHGQLYKRSKNGLNKEWKKKFVCIYSDGRLCYFQNIKVFYILFLKRKALFLVEDFDQILGIVRLVTRGNVFREGNFENF